MADRRLVLLDTDIGNDIDDAVCLAYLLAQPRCELLGITTVTARPDLRARLASAFVDTRGGTCRSIPVPPIRFSVLRCRADHRRPWCWIAGSTTRRSPPNPQWIS